ncbi:MAG: hypothetical protein B7C24_15770 [Bacteroidetes bacterium 4572_77]|nr:MAG: hypothetical protein B7C24_15770 [Bacteroidetes bacterium 4572_77]
MTQACTYTEQFEPEHTYTFKGKCLTSGNDVSVTVNGCDLYRYNQGDYIQDAFPYLTTAEREWMMSGMFEWPEFNESDFGGD